MEAEDVKKNLQKSSTWLRGFYMLLFIVFYGIAETIALVIAIVQFGHQLIGQPSNQRLLTFGQSLATYMYEVVQFLTYNDEKKPFPMSEWPTTSSKS